MGLAKSPDSHFDSPQGPLALDTRSEAIGKHWSPDGLVSAIIRNVRRPRLQTCTYTLIIQAMNQDS